jgi:hypothetical protein
MHRFTILVSWGRSVNKLGVHKQNCKCPPNKRDEKEDDCPPSPCAAGDDIGADNSHIKLTHLQNLLYIMLKTNLCSHGEGQLCNEAKET